MSWTEKKLSPRYCSMASYGNSMQKSQWTGKEIRTVTGKWGGSLQGVQTIHLRYSMTGRQGNENICHGKRTKNN